MMHILCKNSDCVLQEICVLNINIQKVFTKCGNLDLFGTFLFMLIPYILAAGY